MKPQATRLTSRQLAYLAHWQNRGYTIGRDEAIPEDTRIAPGGDDPTIIEMAVSALLLIAAFVLMYFV